MNDFELKVKNYIKENNLIENNKIILAFSFGIDSRSLLNVLISLGYEVIVAHVNHKVRIESDNEEKETIELCQKLNLKYYIKHLNLPKENFEDLARKERYNFFKEISLKEGTNILVTAHHLTDNLETILLRLGTGSNMYGFAGIHNKVIRNDLQIVRPFMCVTKDEIKLYQKEKGFTYFEDYTNSLNVQTRNKIRNQVLPILDTIFTNPEVKTESYSKILSEAFDYIRSDTISYYKKWNKEIVVDEFIKLKPALRHDILCYLFEQYKINRNFNLILEIDKALLNNKAQFDLKLSNDFYFFKRYNLAYISKKEEINCKEISLNFDESKKFGNFRFYFSKEKPGCNVYYIKLCYNNIVFPVKIRTRENGDKISLPGGGKKIKDLFIDKKIDKSVRENIPLILINNEIVWVVNIAKSKSIFSCKDLGDIYLVCEVENDK